MKNFKFIPALNEIEANSYPDLKTGHVKIALDIEKFNELERIFSADYPGFIRKFGVAFKLSVAFYPQCSQTFILFIDTKESFDAHTKKLGVYSFGANLHYDYALASHYIAQQFCEKNHLIINQEVSHWPIFQYIISVPVSVRTQEERQLEKEKQRKREVMKQGKAYKRVHFQDPYLTAEDGSTIPVSAYHPLTKRMIRQLLHHAHQTGDSRVRNSIQIRLCQGVKGYMSPRETKGFVSDKEDLVSMLYLDNHYAVPTKSLVNKFYKLMNFL